MLAYILGLPILPFLSVLNKEVIVFLTYTPLGQLPNRVKLSILKAL
jgi:hypothetical protein